MALVEVQRTESTSQRSGSGHPSKLDEASREITEWQMCEDDETTAVQLSMIMSSRGYTYDSAPGEQEGLPMRTSLLVYR